MWTSQRRRTQSADRAPAELGAVTLGGDPAGVSLGGERRWLAVYGPGGYQWRPEPGERVLVLKAGEAGESPCLLGRAQEGADLAPGEVRISGGGSAIRLGRERLELTGSLYINGKSLEELVRELAGGEGETGEEGALWSTS